MRDDDRMRRVARGLVDEELDALLCTLPANVLLTSGYWPVIGDAFAIATREGAVGLAVPEDERALAGSSWADEIRTFRSGSLESIVDRLPAACGAASALRGALGLRPDARVGYEGGTAFDPCGYASTFVYGAAARALVEAAFPEAPAVDATALLAGLRSVLTAREASAVRTAARTAGDAYADTRAFMRAGNREDDVAARLRMRLARHDDGATRAGGFAYCMSGPNAAEAYAAFQRSTTRAIARGDFVLVHCNSYRDGFWTDVTRTFSIGPPRPRHTEILDAVLSARDEALAAIRPGVRASTVDEAARRVLDERGFGAAFVHPTGHGVGYAAIDHGARPRLHPCSPDVLEPGMVCNVEPGVYLPDVGGMRHCDMVRVTDEGYELLTRFLGARADLILE